MHPKSLRASCSLVTVETIMSTISDSPYLHLYSDHASSAVFCSAPFLPPFL